MKNVLIVSPYYPPGPTACAHRARHLAKHLNRWGWQPVIMCVDENFLEEKLDYGLMKLTARKIEVVKCKALPADYVRPFGLGEVTLRSWPFMRADIWRLLKKRSFDAVLFTGSHFYSMLHAPMVRNHFGVPIILDFQDPWISAWGATQPRFSKAGMAHKLATLLEPKVIAAADFITSVSETQNSEMRARYPQLTADRMAAIPIGGDPEDYVSLRADTTRTSSGPVNWNGQKTLAYVGTIMPRTVPLVETFMSTFAEARKREYRLRDVRIVFVGTSNQPNDTTTYQVLPIARRYGIEQNVEEIPQRLPFIEALTVLSRADGVLLIGSDEPHYTASKIYPGLMSGRPYLSLFHQASSSHEILSHAGGGIALGFHGPDELPGLNARLGDAIIRLVTAPDALGNADPAAYIDYTAVNIARRYAELFDMLDARRRLAD